MTFWENVKALYSSKRKEQEENHYGQEQTVTVWLLDFCSQLKVSSVNQREHGISVK